MKASELRIGNYVSLPSGSILELDATDILLFFERKSKEPCIKPIPVTEQWLMDFGFNKFEYIHAGYYFQKGDVIYDSGFVSKEVPDYGTYVQYVHQLQNLYFALTGEELKLNK